MLFHTFDFAVFLPIVFVLYWFVFKYNLRLQNFFLVVASYVFYGWWDWRFLILLFISTSLDYTMGILIGNQQSKIKKRGMLVLSLVINLGLLGYFKYYNFFIENFVEAFSFLGYHFSATSLKIVLPVGISFYTFQSISYCIDVYRGQLKPTRDYVSYLAYVSFFPQLVAGPIERAINLLPQFYKPRVFDVTAATDGMRQILWGLFKKVVIADSCAFFADDIFNNSDQYPGSTLLLGAIFFAFQIYGDFSGYSDIAIGTARLFGFTLMRNFAFPYFSRDIAEFWRRWHISLSTWFRDYLYVPLGGSKRGKQIQIRNTIIIFLASGFWHGANWTFLFWGALHALYFMPLLLLNYNRKNLDIAAVDAKLPGISELLQMMVTFTLVVLAWIFFRAENLQHAFAYIGTIFSGSILNSPALDAHAWVVGVFILMLIAVEWIGRREQYGIQTIGHSWPRVLRWGFYYALAALIFIYSGGEQQFIYFQF